MFEINFDYLKQLKKPEEAITEGVWNEITNVIKDRNSINEKFNYITEQRVNTIAPYFGLLWNNEKDNPCSYYLEEFKYDDIYKNYTRSWFRKNIVLYMFSLFELNNDDKIENIYNKVYKYSNKELKDMEFAPYYEKIRIEINQFLTKEKNNISNDNFEDICKQFIKHLIKVLMNNGDFNTEEISKYVNTMYYRFINVLNYQEIGEKLDIKHGSVGNILHKFINEFKKAYNKDEQIAYLCRKFEKFYDEAFDKLDKSDYEIRNKRLSGLKLFQTTFIGESLGEFIY
jgi:hypothetical protein